MMSDEGVIIDAEEEKMALQLFPRVSLVLLVSSYINNISGCWFGLASS